MPSLIRFLIVCAILVGCFYSGVFALAYLLEPTPREMTVRVPPAKLKP